MDDAASPSASRSRNPNLRSSGPRQDIMAEHEAVAATAISSAALAHTIRAKFLLKRQATIKIQTATRGRASRMLIASIRAARGFARFLGRNLGACCIA